MRVNFERLFGHLAAFCIGILGIYGPDYIAPLFGKTASPGLALGIGVMLFFISERYLLDRELERFLRRVNSRAKESNATTFASMPEALRYVIDNARRCKGIYNTRLANPDAEERLRLQELYRQHDKAIADAIIAGCDCSLVVDVAGLKSLERFQARRTSAEFQELPGSVWTEPRAADDPVGIQGRILRYPVRVASRRPACRRCEDDADQRRR